MIIMVEVSAAFIFIIGFIVGAIFGVFGLAIIALSYERKKEDKKDGKRIKEKGV